MTQRRVIVDIARLRRLAAEGATIAAAARIMGHHYKVISSAARREKIAPAKSTIRQSRTVDRALLRRLADEGKTAAEAARISGHRHSVVSKIARLEGFAFQKGKAGPRSKIGHDALRALADEGKTLQQAADALRAHYNVVHRRARQLGVEFRRAGQGPNRFGQIAPFLTPAEAEDFKFLRNSHHYSVADALRAIKRADLLHLVPNSPAK